MTFDEYNLYEAIWKVRSEIEERRASGEDLPALGSDEWYTKRRDELLRLVNSKKPPEDFYAPDAIVSAWTRYRRTKKGEFLSCDLVVLVGRLHGRKCFYAGRGKGNCSGDIDLDRLVPGSSGGEYTPENCTIACTRHNRERGDLPIEKYLSGGDMSPPAGA